MTFHSKLFVSTLQIVSNGRDLRVTNIKAKWFQKFRGRKTMKTMICFIRTHVVLFFKLISKLSFKLFVKKSYNLCTVKDEIITDNGLVEHPVRIHTHKTVSSLPERAKFGNATKMYRRILIYVIDGVTRQTDCWLMSARRCQNIITFMIRRGPCQCFTLCVSINLIFCP